MPPLRTLHRQVVRMRDCVCPIRERENGVAAPLRGAWRMIETRRVDIGRYHVIGATCESRNKEYTLRRVSQL